MSRSFAVPRRTRSCKFFWVEFFGGRLDAIGAGCKLGHEYWFFAINLAEWNKASAVTYY